MQWIEHVDLEKDFVAYMVPIEWDALDHRDVGNKYGLFVLDVPPVADCKRIVD